MPLQPERVFDPAKPVYVRRSFIANGRHLEPGTLFDWRHWSVNERRVRQLFDAGKLMHQSADQPIEQPVEPNLAEEIAALVVEQPSPAAVEDDGLDLLNMKELRAIAEAEGAPTRLRREDQREAIREHRRARATAET